MVSDEDIAAMLIRYILFFLFFILCVGGWVGRWVCVCVWMCVHRDKCLCIFKAEVMQVGSRPF